MLINDQLSDGWIFRQLYRENRNSYVCNSSVLREDVAPPTCVLQTLERWYVLAIFVRNASVRRLQFSDKMVDFRTVLIIGIQKQSQITTVGSLSKMNHCFNHNYVVISVSCFLSRSLIVNTRKSHCLNILNSKL